MSGVLTLNEQRQLVLRWLESPAAHAAGRALCRRRGLPESSSGDLVHDGWIRVDESFRRRSAPYPELTNEVTAEKFARRVLSNLAIDRARNSAHRRVSPADDDAAFDQVTPAPWAGTVAGFTEVETRDSVFRLRRRVGVQIATEVDPCPGCPSNVVAAVALYVCNALACGDVPNSGSNPLDRLIYEGLQTHDPAHFASIDTRPTDAQRKRKSRCGTCVVHLLRTCAAQLGLAG